MEWRVTLPEEEASSSTSVPCSMRRRCLARGGVSYWEGAVEVEGSRNGKRMKGRGYLEMTGYSGRALGELLKPRFSRPSKSDLNSPVVTEVLRVPLHADAERLFGASIPSTTPSGAERLTTKPGATVLTDW